MLAVLDLKQLSLQPCFPLDPSAIQKLHFLNFLYLVCCTVISSGSEKAIVQNLQILKSNWNECRVPDSSVLN